jgi:Tol biopolymer transport system component
MIEWSSADARGRGRRVLVMMVLMGCAACAAGSEEDSGARGDGSPAVEREPDSGEVFFTGLRQLTFEGQNAEAYFSANGTRLIFQRSAEPESCDQQYVMNVDGSDMLRVSNGLGRTTCGYFLQNDQRIVYSSTFAADSACPTRPDMSRGYVWPLSDFEIYTSQPDGSDLQQLTHSPGYDAEATLSPDGTRIVFTSTRDGDIDIYTMNVDGSDVRRLTSAVGYDGGPFFSPDGSQIVYRAWHPEDQQGTDDFLALLADNLVRPSRMEIWVMDADGSNQRQVTSLGGASFAPYFHPDGERIIFASNHVDPRSRNFDLYVIGVDGTGLRQVTTSPEFDGFPMFSPDGTKLVFASNRYGATEGDTNIFVAEWVEP